jgi:aminoglycoside 6'-N-acetyltransferase I
MYIRKANRKDFKPLLQMALSLWPDEPEEQVVQDLDEMFGSARQAVFVALDENGSYIAFIDVSTRREYVSGGTFYPVGYIEGIYVKPGYRRQGIAQALVEAGETWASHKGCKQIASDTWLWNTASQEFHKKVGFAEKERLVTYIKRIDTERIGRS